jgi:hypothetical protein
LYVSHEGLPGNTVSFVQLSKNRINFQYKLLISEKKLKTRLGILHLIFGAKLIRKKVGHHGHHFHDFRDLFSCTILMKDFPEKPEMVSMVSKKNKTKNCMALFFGRISRMENRSMSFADWHQFSFQSLLTVKPHHLHDIICHPFYFLDHERVGF